MLMKVKAVDFHHVPPEQQDAHTRLNDLLAGWHKWCARYSGVKGYSSTDLTCKDYRPSRQYDDQNGALDADLESSTLETVSAEIFAMEQPYQTAIQIQARNLATRRIVWASPRLPADAVERSKIVAKAREILIDALARRGILL